ncbi:MAG: hypothetical protein IJA12_02155 [Oscillospiraceae bacterium]|nr:hypothetical protein [Oscillospiraceae bacterium]
MNILKRVSAVLLAGLSSAVLLTGCGGIEDDIIGTWKCDKISMEGLELDPSTFAETYGVELEMKLEVTEDKLIIDMNGEKEEEEYELKDNVLKEEDGAKLYYDEDSEKIVMEGDEFGEGGKVTFVKE